MVMVILVDDSVGGGDDDYVDNGDAGNDNGDEDNNDGDKRDWRWWQ